MKSYFQKIAGSTTTPILPKSVFEEIEIHLPDMKKQKDVVSILYALDRKIELNKQINDNLRASRVQSQTCLSYVSPQQRKSENQTSWVANYFKTDKMDTNIIVDIAKRVSRAIAKKRRNSAYNVFES